MAALLLATLAAIPYLQTGAFGFIDYDDDVYITNNAWVLNGLSDEGTRWAFASGGYAATWHPVTWLSFMLDVSLFGVAPGWMHIENALLHTACAVLLLVLLWRLLGRLDAAFMAAALWALHPLRVETVAWVSQRKELLGTLFGLAAVICHVASLRLDRAASSLCYGGSRSNGPDQRPSLAWWQTVSLLCFALAFMSKPTVVTFPLLAGMIEYMITGTVRWPNLLLPFWGMAVGIAVTLYTQRLGGAINTDAGLDLRALNALSSLGVYLRQTIAPLGLAAIYPLRWPAPVNIIGGVAAGGTLALILWHTGFSPRARLRGPVGVGGQNRWSLFPYAAGIGWFLVALAPMVGLVQIADQAHADRFASWPSVGLSLSAGWMIASLSACRPRLAVLARCLVGALVVLFAVVTWRQARYWVSTSVLFSHACDVVPGNQKAHRILGWDYCIHGRLDEGIWHFRQAYAALGDSRNGVSLVWSLVRRGDLEGADRVTKVLWRERPDDVYTRLALAILARARESPAAGRLLLEVLILIPDCEVGWWEYGVWLADAQRWQEAMAAWQRALELSPQLKPVARLCAMNARRVEGQARMDWRALLAPGAQERARGSPMSNSK